jgi:hypothetical protein
LAKSFGFGNEDRRADDPKMFWCGGCADKLKNPVQLRSRVWVIG